MKECPLDATITNCGLHAAQHLADEKLIVIDNIGRRILGQPEIRIRPGSLNVVEVFELHRQYQKHPAHNFAEFGCLACGQIIEIEDQGGDMSSRKIVSDY
jgi:hypothetical protein